MIVVTFALPDESRGLVAALTGKSILAGAPLLPVIGGICAGQRVTVVHTGVGEIPVYRQRLKRILEGGDSGPLAPPRLLISSGYAGGLQPTVRVGDLVLATNFSEPSLVRRAQEAITDLGPRLGALTSRSETLETAEEKRALGVSSSALAVDMETGWITALAAQTNVPMISLRVISDAVDQPFPVPAAVLFDAERQRPRYIALPVWLALHPGRIGTFVRFVRGLGPARARLTSALQILIERLA